MRLRGQYIHFEIEKISIFLCQKVTHICVLDKRRKLMGENLCKHIYRLVYKMADILS